MQAGRPPLPAQGRYDSGAPCVGVEERGECELQTKGWDTVAFTDGSMIQEEVGAGYVVPDAGVVGCT